MKKLSAIFIFGIIILVFCPNFPVVQAQDISQKRVWEDGVGRVFKIDGKPDPSYKLRTPADAVYAFIDLIKSNDLVKLRKVMGGPQGVLNGNLKPMDSDEFESWVNKKRRDYIGASRVRIDKFDPGKMDNGTVHYTLNGNNQQYLWVRTDGRRWYVSGANLGLLFRKR